MEPASAILRPWENFYLIAGPAAATLVGLVFVVISIISGSSRQRSPLGTAIFTTPTIVHFSAVILFALAVTVPWRSLVWLAVVLATANALGIAYTAFNASRAKQLDGYEPDAEDVCCHLVLPFGAYGIAFVAGLGLLVLPHAAMFALACAIGALIFTGVHNAWDIVTFIAVVDADGDGHDGRRARQAGSAARAASTPATAAAMPTTTLPPA